MSRGQGVVLVRAATLLEAWFLGYLSQPQGDRALYRAILRQRPARIVEIAMAQSRRTLRMARLATRLNRSDKPVRYTVIDQFELGRSGVSLKDTYRALRGQNVKARVVPGDPATALARAANELPGSDLVVIGAEMDRGSPGWAYVPRMLHRKSLVFCEVPGGGGGATRFQLITGEEVERRAASLVRHRRAA